MTVGQKIKKYRVRQGLTQKEFGLMVGFSAATADSRIRKYESGKMIPKRELLEKMADILEIHSSRLTDHRINDKYDLINAIQDAIEEGCVEYADAVEILLSLV